MFPNASNTSLELLTISSKTDKLGNKINFIKRRKKVIGSKRSITSQEYQSSVSLSVKYDFKVMLQALTYDGSKYAVINNSIFKIERTFINGQFIELYLVLSDLKLEDLDVNSNW